MNLDQWKATCERHAGHTIKWTDVKDTYWGLTSWGDDGSCTYSIIPSHRPQCAIIENGHERPFTVAPTQPALF